jgi:hypothetical protein
MTQTIAIIVNAVLMAGIVLAVGRTMHFPFRIERRVKQLEHALYVPGEDEFSRAA